MPYLFRLVESGTYSVRVKIQTKSYRVRLGTDKLPVARVRAREGLLEHHINPQKKDTPGTLASLEEEYLKRLSNDPDIAPGTIEYKKSLLAALRKCWPLYSARSIANLTNLDLIGRRTILAQKYAPTRTNGAITVIRELLDLAEKQGAVHDVDRLLKDVEFVRVAGVNLRKLPSKAQFDALRAEVYRRSKVTGTWGMLLFDFLAYSGCRNVSRRPQGAPRPGQRVPGDSGDARPVPDWASGNDSDAGKRETAESPRGDSFHTSVVTHDDGLSAGSPAIGSRNRWKPRLKIGRRRNSRRTRRRAPTEADHQTPQIRPPDNRRSVDLR